jgi:hypothetical protein
MYAIDSAPQPHSTTLPPASDASSHGDVALAIAKAHFTARGWRPMVIQPPVLQELCEDVSALLLMNDAGDTVWLSTRHWAALADPVDAFRREMVCVSAARVNETILVYDGDFPENVVEAAVHESSLRLVDAVVLRTMSPSPSRIAAAVSTAAATTRRQRLARPARQAAHYLAQVMDTRPLAAAERYFQDKFATRLRQLDGERRKLKTLSSALLVLVGASLGFLAFSMVMLMRTPESDEAVSRVVQMDSPPLPQPMPPPQGYVAQAAGVSDATMRSAYISSPQQMASQPRLLAAAPTSDGSQASSAMPGTGGVHGYEDVEQTQRRADDAMRVIASSTREVRVAHPPATSTTIPTSSASFIRSGDPAMAEGDASSRDPAMVD